MTAADRKTLYIAGPMTGLPDHNYRAFDEAVVDLLSVGYGTLNPVDAEQHNPTLGGPR